MDLRGVIVVDDTVLDRAQRASVHSTEHVANRPIAHHVFDALEAAGATEVVVASSARAAGAVRDCLSVCERPERTPLRFVQQPAPLRLTSALPLVAPIVADSACIVHAAEGLLAEPLAPLTESLKSGPDAVLMVHHTAVPDQRLSVAAQSILHLAELDPSRSSLGVAGVWAFGPGALRHAAADHGARDGLTDVAERITAAGGTIQVRVADVWRVYRGDASDLLELNQIVLDGLEGERYRLSSNGNRIEGRVWIHDQASVESSVIVGPTVIGEGARVSDSYIGPYTSIGPRARVVGTEIERSIISAGASVAHVGHRLVASVVGRDARVFRDFSLPRALRLRVGEGTEVALC